MGEPVTVHTRSPILATGDSCGTASAGPKQHDVIRGNLKALPLRHPIDHASEHQVIDFLVMPTVPADQVVVLASLDLVTGLPITWFHGHHQAHIHKQLQCTVHRGAIERWIVAVGMGIVVPGRV